MHELLLNTLRARFKEVRLYTLDNLPKEHRGCIDIEKNDILLVIKNNGTSIKIESNSNDSIIHILETIDECFD